MRSEVAVWLGSGAMLALLLVSCNLTGTVRATSQPSSFVQFDGISSHIDVPDSPDLSVATSGALTVSAWMRPDTLSFAKAEGSGYVYWLGKGSGNQQEWTFRMYSQPNSENRANRISFYVFNLSSPQPPNLGIGSHFQDPVAPGEWIYVVGVVDGHQTHIYKNGVQRDCDQYNTNTGDPTCNTYPSTEWITPRHGSAPMRMGTRDLRSYFQGGLGEVRIWNRVLSADEISALYARGVTPKDGLVAEYLFAERAGTTAHDTAGAHDATLVSATWGGTSPPAETVMPPAPSTQMPPTSETLNGAGVALSFTPGQPFSGTLASFTEPDPAVLAGDLEPAVDWGDGATSTGTVSGSNGAFQVSDSHTYADQGPFTVQITLTNINTGAQAIVVTTATATSSNP